ncbi:hypothetical protein FBUS_01153, partial [Fasciolopsis buskii]
ASLHAVFDDCGHNSCFPNSPKLTQTGPCRPHGDGFCHNRVRESLCSAEKDECFCKHGFVAIQDGKRIICTKRKFSPNRICQMPTEDQLMEISKRDKKALQTVPTCEIFLSCTVMKLRWLPFFFPVLTDLQCQVDADCVHIHNSKCHPGVGVCACPAGTIFVPEFEACSKS